MNPVYVAGVAATLLAWMPSTQNRDTAALHLKLDELIRVTEARNELIVAEDMSDSQLRETRDRLRGLAR